MISNKMHRATSIVAAILLLVSIVFSLVNLVNSVTNALADDMLGVMLPSMIVTVLTMIANAAILVVLLRGKKDVLAGIMFILSALVLLITGVAMQMITLVSMTAVYSYNPDIGQSMLTGSAIRIVTALIGIVFRIMIAVECFKPGKISGGKSKAILIILPIVITVLYMATSVVQQFYMLGDFGSVVFLTSVVLPAVLGMFDNLWLVLTGICVSIPVRVRSQYRGY